MGNLHLGSVREYEVVGFHDVGGGGGRGGDHHGAAAEVEEDQWAVELGQPSEGAVGEEAQLVEVAENGEGWWGRR